jgi:hypothetical protein
MHNIAGIMTNYGGRPDDERYRELYLRPFDAKWGTRSIALEQFLESRLRVHMPNSTEEVRGVGFRLRKAIVLPLILLCALVAVAYWAAGSDFRPSKSLRQLLGGSFDVEIASVAIRGQGRSAMLADLRSTAYLTKIFRSAFCEGHVSDHCGITYAATVTLTSGGGANVRVFVPAEPTGLTIAFDDSLGLADPIYYWIPLQEPVPDAVATALNMLK